MADTFHSGDFSPENSIYQAIHMMHSLVHEVTVMQNQQFPECLQCGDGVRFQSVRRLSDDQLPSYPGFHGMLTDKVA